MNAYNFSIRQVFHIGFNNFTFSLGKKLRFKKYYVKLFLFLCNIGFTNAWIYKKMCNPDATKKYGSRADSFESIVEAMVNPNTNWSAKYPVEHPNKRKISKKRTLKS